MSVLKLWFLFVGVPSIKIFFIILVGFCCLACVFIVADAENTYKNSKKIFLTFLFSGLGFLIPAIILPTKQDVALILGAHYVTNQEQLGEVPEKAFKLLNHYLDDALQASNK